MNNKINYNKIKNNKNSNINYNNNNINKNNNNKHNNKNNYTNLSINIAMQIVKITILMNNKININHYMNHTIIISVNIFHHIKITTEYNKSK